MMIMKDGILGNISQNRFPVTIIGAIVRFYFRLERPVIVNSQIAILLFPGLFKISANLTPDVQPPPLKISNTKPSNL
ncbi:unnamed protein product [Schistosoma mattheei]|uniref:Uncharacterized protein n=1 Tax=Schistosoma mattheei TaxID=31246 RepID=A0A183NDV6_9TREM|nr:unnamed protein product [Schistosoma mattheei]